MYFLQKVGVIIKTISLAVDISQFLSNNQCTYYKTEQILELLKGEFQQQKTNIEYTSINDFMCSKKSACADNELIRPLNHVTLDDVVDRIESAIAE